jgi:hypothetical protein
VKPGAAALARASWAAAALLVAAQAWPHLVDIRRDQYAPGGAWEPRVKAIVDVSRVAARGGPYLSVPAGSGFEPPDLKVNDLGYSAFGYVWGRALGQPLNRRVLMLLNLTVMLVSLGALLFSIEPVPRLLVCLLLLFTPIPVPAYRSPDPLATHASLALLGVALSGAPLRRWPYWASGIAGALLFAIHKVRSAYALYAGAALVAVALVGAWRTRSRLPLLRAGVALAASFALEALWQVPLQLRAMDPRVSRQDALGTHPIYVPLLEGVGWSENRWGIKPWDPWVAQYLAERFGGDAVNVGSNESERRARRAYFDLWLQDAPHLLAVYVRRLPGAARDHFFVGIWGALAWLLIVPAAMAVGLRLPSTTLWLLLGSVGVLLSVLFQTVVLDPRLLYAYPLRVVSAASLGLALGLLLERELPTSPSGTPPRSP